MSASQTSARTPTPASRAPLGGGSSMAPAGRSGSLRMSLLRLRASTWWPVAGKAVAIAAGMLALAGIGARSALSGTGVPVASASAVPGPSAVPPRIDAPPRTAPATPAEPGATPPSTAAASGSGLTPDGKVVLNRATVEELCKLPRVGAKRAQAIVDLRHRLGRFRQPTDLLRVRGIGRKTLRLMLPLLVVDDPGVAKAAAEPRGPAKPLATEPPAS